MIILKWFCWSVDHLGYMFTLYFGFTLKKRCCMLKITIVPCTTQILKLHTWKNISSCLDFFFSKCDDLVQYLTHHQSALPQPITSSFVKLNLIENWLIWWKKKINIQIHVSSNKLCYLERQSYMYHQFLMKYSTIHRND